MTWLSASPKTYLPVLHPTHQVQIPAHKLLSPVMTFRPLTADPVQVILLPETKQQMVPQPTQGKMHRNQGNGVMAPGSIYTAYTLPVMKNRKSNPKSTTRETFVYLCSLF